MKNKYKVQLLKNYCTGPSTKSSFNDKRSEQISFNSKIKMNSLQLKNQTEISKGDLNILTTSSNNNNNDNSHHSNQHHPLLHYHNHHLHHKKEESSNLPNTNQLTKLNKIKPRAISRDYRFKSVNKTEINHNEDSKDYSCVNTESSNCYTDFKGKLKTLESLLEELASFNSKRLNKEIDTIYKRAMKIKESQLNNDDDDDSNKSNDVLLAKKIIELDEKYQLIKKENGELKALIDKKMNDYNTIYKEFNALNALFGKKRMNPTKVHKKNSISTDYKMPKINYFQSNNHYSKNDNELLLLDTVDLLNRYDIKGQDTKKYLYYQPKVKMINPRIKTAIPKLNISELNDSNELFNSFVYHNNNDDLLKNVDGDLDGVFAIDSNITLGDFNKNNKMIEDKIKNKEQIVLKPAKKIKFPKADLV